MAKILNNLIVLVISIVLLSSSLTFVGGLQPAENIVPATDPEPTGPALFDPWPTFTGTTIYHSWDEAEAEMLQIALDHPDIVQLTSLTKTWEGRDVWAFKISDNPTVEEPDEPEVFFNSLHHAREWMTIEIALYAIHFLTDNYGTNATVTDIVDNRQIWIIPVVNPDGRVIDSPGDDPTDHTAQPYGWRKNARDNNGDEVFDEAFDGVDLNRNYDWLWGSSGQQSDPTNYLYGGPTAFSEPESIAIRDLCIEHDFVFAVNYHTYSQLILYPWGWTFEDTEDHDLLVSVAWDLEGRITNLAGSAHDGYVPEQGADLYPTSGGTDDWMYGNQGILSYTIEAYPYYDWDGGGPESSAAIQEPYDLFHPREDKVLPVCQDNLPAIIRLCEIADNPFQVMDHIEISTIDTEMVIDKGTGDSTTIDLLNNGQGDGDYTITTSSIAGWSIIAAPSSLNILKDQTVQSSLDITVPGAAAPGEYTIWVNVSMDTNSTCTDSCQIIVIVPYSDDVGVDSIYPFEEMGTYPRGEYQIDGTVKNYGEFQVPTFDTTCTISRFGGGTNYNLFSDDMESGMTQWVTEDWDGTLTNDYWHTVSSRSNSPSNSMHCGPGTSDYTIYSNQFLTIAEPIDLREAETATLTYWTWHELVNDGYDADFCVVEGSVDGGHIWSFIDRYTGDDMTWRERTNDLTNFTGYSEFLLRYRFTSDNMDYGDAGFYFDDISIDAFIPGETVVFGPTIQTTSAPLDTQLTETLGWQYDFDQSGTYRVSIETQYGADGNTPNDLLDVIFDIGSTHLPDFTGVDDVINIGTGDQLDIYWNAANDPNLPIIYSLYRFDNLPNEAEVNASSPIWTGTALSYSDNSVIVGETYFYIVRASDALGQEDWNMLAIDGTPSIQLLFQVQSPMAGFRDLNNDAFETSIQTITGPDITGAGQYMIGGIDDHWLSEVYTEAQSMDGTWNFNVWGQMNNDKANANLFARVFRYSDDAMLFETGLDNEDVSGFVGAYHEFTWQYLVSGVTLPAGDRFYVELWLDATTGATGQTGETLNPDFDTNANSWTYYDWEDTGGGDSTGAWAGSYVNVRLDDANTGGSSEQTYSGYWEQTFSTGMVPDSAYLELDWSCTEFDGGSANLIAYAFVDTISGAPTVGNQVWSSGQITSVTSWVSTGQIDLTGIVDADTTYYLKVGLRDTNLAKSEGQREVGFDNVKVTYGQSVPVFTFAYDHQTTPTGIEAALTPIGGGMTYDIDLTGVVDGTWVMASFPIFATGNPVTIIDDALHGDGGTTWDSIMWYDTNDVDHWKSYDKAQAAAGIPQDLLSVDNDNGFWIHIASNSGDELLSIGTGSQPATSSIILEAGWNLIGYPSATTRQADLTLPGEVTKIAFYNDAQAYSIQELPLSSVTMSSGNAYWVYSTVMVQWDVDW